MRSKRKYDKNFHISRANKNPKTLHDKDMKDSSEYVAGAHDVVGEDARKSRDKARRFNDKLI